MNLNESSCNSCAYYSNTDDELINCAVNPGSNSRCKDYNPIVEKDLLMQAIAQHKRQEFLKWRASGMARFGVEVPLPSMSSEWVMPSELINRLNAALPTLVQHPKLTDRSQVDVAIALVRWIEDYILRWIDAKNMAESADNEHFPLTKYLP